MGADIQDIAITLCKLANAINRTPGREKIASPPKGAGVTIG